MDTRRPDPAVVKGGGTGGVSPSAEGGGVAAASCLVNHDGELGPRRQRNSVTHTIQRLRLPGERFPALNSPGTKSWRRKRLLKAARIHRASHVEGKALKLNCRAFIFQFLRWLFY